MENKPESFDLRTIKHNTFFSLILPISDHSVLERGEGGSGERGMILCGAVRSAALERGEKRVTSSRVWR